MAGFEVADIEVAGGRLGICPMPGRSGAYFAELSQLLAWRPALVMSLTGLAEMEAVGAEDIGEVLAAAEVAWRHWPIKDFGVPDNSTWPAIRDDVLRLLSKGGRVAVHCRAGCGRSGMVALRLMVEAGEARTTALARLRAVRPCAIETDAQMAWATRS